MQKNINLQSKKENERENVQPSRSGRNNLENNYTSLENKKFYDKNSNSNMLEIDSIISISTSNTESTGFNQDIAVGINKDEENHKIFVNSPRKSREHTIKNYKLSNLPLRLVFLDNSEPSKYPMEETDLTKETALKYNLSSENLKSIETKDKINTEVNRPTKCHRFWEYTKMFLCAIPSLINLVLIFILSPVLSLVFSLFQPYFTRTIDNFIVKSIFWQKTNYFINGLVCAHAFVRVPLVSNGEYSKNIDTGSAESKNYIDILVLIPKFGTEIKPKRIEKDKNSADQQSNNFLSLEDLTDHIAPDFNHLILFKSHGTSLYSMSENFALDRRAIREDLVIYLVDYDMNWFRNGDLADLEMKTFEKVENSEVKNSSEQNSNEKTKKEESQSEKEKSESKEEVNGKIVESKTENEKIEKNEKISSPFSVLALGISEVCKFVHTFDKMPSLLGFSLGCAMCLGTLEEMTKNGTKIQDLILEQESTPFDLEIKEDLAKDQKIETSEKKGKSKLKNEDTKIHHVFLLAPFQSLYKQVGRIGLMNYLVSDRIKAKFPFNNLERVGNILKTQKKHESDDNSTKISLYHGTIDQVIPVSDAANIAHGHNIKLNLVKRDHCGVMVDEDVWNDISKKVSKKIAEI